MSYHPYCIGRQCLHLQNEQLYVLELPHLQLGLEEQSQFPFAPHLNIRQLEFGLNQLYLFSELVGLGTSLVTLVERLFPFFVHCQPAKLFQKDLEINQQILNYIYFLPLLSIKNEVFLFGKFNKKILSILNCSTLRSSRSSSQH